MPHRLLVPMLLVAALAGCRGEARYRDIHVWVEAQVLKVTIRGPAKGTPCPPSLVEGTARVNGIAMKQVAFGGGDPDPDTDEAYCEPLRYRLDVADLPAETETLDITFDTLRAPNGHPYEPARGWHMTVDWAPERIWTDDDLAARMHANEEFEVQWRPRDTVLPELKLSGYDNSGIVPLEAEATLIHSEPGKARYRFDGPEPSVVWSALAIQRRNPRPTLCTGFKRCEMGSSLIQSLHAGGLIPITPDGVAPPRQCIVAPGATREQYRSPRASSLPDLSRLQPTRNESCDGADLYFVVLGACGVCGGGKSTYVVGNRGTEASTFSVRSNIEMLEGGVLEPEQLSEPFEIGFDGELSALEIVNEGDCDPASNTQWVASIVCTQLQFGHSFDECGVQRFEEWALTGMCRLGQEDGCNNLCDSE